MIKKKPVIALFLCLGIISVGINQSKYMTSSEKEEMRIIREKGLYPIDLINTKKEELHKQELFNKEVERKQQEIIEYLNSPEYKKRELIRKLSKETGLNITDIKQVTFKTTAYTSLADENGGYTVTCNGKPLEGKIVANNTLPQFSKIILNDEVYTVADKGSSRFNNSTRLDVLMERNYGESDNDYRKRVSNYGVQNIEGYILEIQK